MWFFKLLSHLNLKSIQRFEWFLGCLVAVIIIWGWIDDDKNTNTTTETSNDNNNGFVETPKIDSRREIDHFDWKNNKWVYKDEMPRKKTIMVHGHKKTIIYIPSEEDKFDDYVNQNIDYDYDR